MRRELEIAMYARATWLTLALAALLVGHGFVLAIDLYTASSRTALASAFSVQQMDPLAGIVRPTLGGVDLAIALLAPLVAARPLAIEKERRSFAALCLARQSCARIVLEKFLAALIATSLLLVPALTSFAAFVLSGAHLGFAETALALSGEFLHLVLIVAVSLAAAAWTRSFAQAATLGIVISVTSWAIDSAEGFSALAWLGGAANWSIERRVMPFSNGIISLGSWIWLGVAVAGALMLAMVGATLGRTSRWKAMRGIAVAALSAALLYTTTTRRAWDVSEAHRASLPPAAVAGLRAIALPLSLEVYLDRDDSRRRQLESDVIAKLWLARPDIIVKMPLDESDRIVEAERDTGYGRIVIHAGQKTSETRSTSRRELVTLLFETAGGKLPDWSQPAYSGYPFVVEGSRRTWLVCLAYLALPFVFLAAGALLTWRRTPR